MARPPTGTKIHGATVIIRAARRHISTSVTITDPLIKYQALVATGVYSPDPSQHRLAKHLQKVYGRLKDYTPSIEYRKRLKQITEITSKPEDESPTLAVKRHPIWRNPLFKRLFTAPEGNDNLALIRVLTNHQAALEIDSPKGLFLAGEVGRGKSLLVDMLYEGLPTHRKKRWHFNTFMLYSFSQLEGFRRSHPQLSGGDQEYSLLWLAKKLVEESPILFLDEFQLPDRAASKILSHLLIAFFQLGGVLVASSNRVPEELQKAIGVEYTPPPSGGFVRSFFTGGKARARGELFGQSSDFAAFLEVLKARCDFWHMEGSTDWRRREEPLPSSAARSSPLPESKDLGILGIGHALQDASIADEINLSEEPPSLSKPAKYFLPTDSEAVWQDVRTQSGAGDWSPAALVVYGRTISIPHQGDGRVYWDFAKLVQTFGPADYITMASTYHTFIIDNIPVLTVSQKNEARRFITLLDALYEAKCKLIVRAASGPDELFFPDTRMVARKDADGNPVVDADAIHSETIAEAYQDSSSPFRPNISFYDTASATSKYDPDQDSDFGLDDAKEKERKKVDFGNTSAFTGEDERFAYKRAASRLWEMCSSQWHARTGEWWQPLPADARHWEKGPPSKPLKIDINATVKLNSDAKMGPSVELDEPAGLQGLRIEAMKGLDRWKK
ncbi:hypothetical protein ACHAQA_001673 [Verticillium albo-atrum]